MGSTDVGVLWERAAEASITDADYAAAVKHAGLARDYHLEARRRSGPRPAPRPRPGQASASSGPVRRSA